MSETRGISTLNEKLRREEADRINRSNAKILEKLQAVRPSILTSEEWRKHSQRLDKMSTYMHAYQRSTNRSYLGVRASSTTSVFRSGNKKDYDRSSMATPSDCTPFNRSTYPGSDDVKAQMLTTQQPHSRTNAFFQ